MQEEGVTRDAPAVREYHERKKKLQRLNQSMSLVLTNPAPDTPIKLGDAVFLLKRPWFPSEHVTVPEVSFPQEFLEPEEPAGQAGTRVPSSATSAPPSLAGRGRVMHYAETMESVADQDMEYPDHAAGVASQPAASGRGSSVHDNVHPQDSLSQDAERELVENAGRPASVSSLHHVPQRLASQTSPTCMGGLLAEKGAHRALRRTRRRAAYRPQLDVADESEEQDRAPETRPSLPDNANIESSSPAITSTAV